MTTCPLVRLPGLDEVFDGAIDGSKRTLLLTFKDSFRQEPDKSPAKAGSE